MFGRKKHKMRNYSVIISGLLFLASCTSNNNPNSEFFSFKGKTQGTTYSIIIAEESINFSQSEIDELLASFDTVLSTYIDASHISKLNNSPDTYSFKDKCFFFKNCYEQAQEIYKKSAGLFDPSVYSLVKEWGFFNRDETIPGQHQIDSILAFTGFEKGKFHDVLFKDDSVFFVKSDPRFKLDFNAIAQGYSVDVIADFIQSRGHSNYYVEIGGEIRVRGKNKNGGSWKIGIDISDELNRQETKDIISTLSVSDCGIATSGNYRNFFEKNEKKYGHILHPKLGKPVSTDILSATVIAKNATLADAYATLLILLGKNESEKFIIKNPELKATLIYIDTKNEINIYQSENLEQK
jgi:thiamine biosynthesis lipoprotein